MFRNIRKFIAIKVLSLTLGATAAFAAPGDVDPAFGAGGILTVEGDLVAMPDGRIATARRVATGLEFRMLDPDGAPDASWGTDGVSAVALADSGDWFDTAHVTVGEDGSLILHGGIQRVTDGQSSSVPALLRLDPAGRPDVTFGQDGNGIVLLVDRPATVTYLSGLALGSAGSIVVSGTDGDYDYCASYGAVGRLSASGAVDTSFGTNGWVEIAETAGTCLLRTLGVRGDGSIIVSDNFHNFWALRTDGTPDDTFGINGQLSDPLPGLVAAMLLPDGGLLLALQPDSRGGTRFARFPAQARSDNVSVFEYDFGELAFLSGDNLETPVTLALTPDGQSVAFAVMVYPSSTGEPDHFCSGVALLDLSPTSEQVCTGPDEMGGTTCETVVHHLDRSFGRQGLSCLQDTSIGLRSLAIQANGQPLMIGIGGPVLRLLRDNRPSPGLIAFKPNQLIQQENDGTVTLTVARSGGRDGAVSIDYRSLAGTATEGQDYTAGSGRLEWADGEAGDRSIALTIVDDDQQEPVADGTTSGERFEVELSVAAGAALLPDATAIVEILDNDPQAPTPTPTPRASAGGGGSTSPLALLTLLALTACRRRHATRVTHAGCVS